MKYSKSMPVLILALSLGQAGICAEIDANRGRLILTPNDRNQIVEIPEGITVNSIEVPPDEQIQSMATGARFCNAPKCRVQVMIDTDKGHIYRLLTSATRGPIVWTAHKSERKK